MSSFSQSQSTHEVFNQSIPLESYNVYTSDIVLQQHVKHYQGEWGTEHLNEYGAFLGWEGINLGFWANENLPKLKAFDRYGFRIDEVEFHPAYHELMRQAFAHHCHNMPLVRLEKGAHVVRAALNYCHYQIESGTSCPISMTFAATPVIKQSQWLEAYTAQALTSNVYQPECLPISQKQGISLGMAMTEKQGGSDVRANTTVAIPINDDFYPDAFELIGHKWFCSAPMSDGFLVTACIGDALSCFFVPKVLENGDKNAIRIQRLKDKLGNKSNASSEIEFHGAIGHLVGEPGRGIATIIDMVALTRFDCVVGSSGLIRQVTLQALHHAHHRKAFGQRLIDQPLMQNVLADLVLESEAACALMMSLAHALDHQEDMAQQYYLRLATAVSKYWICKRAPMIATEAQECLGGLGYVEESILPRLYREAPLNAIWEGCGNIQALDVLRALAKSPQILEATLAQLEPYQDEHPHFSHQLDQLKNILKKKEHPQYARRMMELLAQLFTARAMKACSPFYETYLQEKCHPEKYSLLGTLSMAGFKPLLERGYQLKS